LIFCLLIILTNCPAQKKQGTANSKKQEAQNQQQASNHNPETRIIPGAERINVYMPLIKGKRIGIFANQTSTVGNTHLVDTLKRLGVDIKVIFGPEHGFRGTADAGEKVGNYVDEKTGVPIVSLYGNKRKPSAEDLKDIDILVFDIQDVGCRFYTIISSLQDFMEAAIDNNKPLLILDRPNPNGFYVDGPVLDLKFKSFVGMQPVPIVYGMTMGEYAQMIYSENWLATKSEKKEILVAPPDAKSASDSTLSLFKNQFMLVIIANNGYTHNSKYVLPVRPSPNLPEIQSIYLYPSTCFFEGTVFSEGRGTDKPFEVFGHPLLSKDLYSFIPKPNEGAKSSKHYFETCYGWNLHDEPDKVLKEVNGRIQLRWLLNAYKLFPGKDSFFLKTNHFNRLAGNDILIQQVKDGKSEEEIRKSWEPGLTQFKTIRKKYLLYPDFE